MGEKENVDVNAKNTTHFLKGLSGVTMVQVFKKFQVFRKFNKPLS